MVVLSSQRRAEQLLREGREFITVRRYRWFYGSLNPAWAGPAVRACRRLLIPGLGIGLLVGMGIGLIKYWKAL